MLLLAQLLATISIPGLATSVARAADTPATTAISVGGNHVCAIVAGGTVMCWGFNELGELGDGTLTSSSTPVAVSGLRGATAIAAGYAHACAVVSGGTVECWGINWSGELGNGSHTDTSTPVAVSGLSGVTAIAAGQHNSCAVVSGGAVECWGWLSNSPVPVVVPGLAGATAVAVGRRHTCALISGGTVECWGWNDLLQLGIGATGASHGSLGPTAVLGLTGVTAIAAGDDDTCALISDGTVECWGESGQFVNGSTDTGVNPVAVTGVTGVTAITAGSSSTCAIVSDGKVKCWHFVGIDQSGRPKLSPVEIGGLDGVAIAISTGRWGTCAVLTDGAVKCWGAFAFEAPTYVSGLGPAPTPRPSGASASTPASSESAFGSITISYLVGLSIDFAVLLILVIALVWFGRRRSRASANAYSAQARPYATNWPGAGQQRAATSWPRTESAAARALRSLSARTSTRWRLFFLGLCVVIGAGGGVAWVGLSSPIGPAVPGSFRLTGDMTSAGENYTAALLADGRVFLAGGGGPHKFASTDIYDPAKGRFTPTAVTDETRRPKTLTLLPGGRVLVIWDDAKASVFDPGTGTLGAAIPMTYHRYGHAAVALSDGRVLVLGGGDDRGHALDSAEIYDPGAGEFTSTGPMNAPRGNVSATLLRDGRVLVVGGNASASAEVYDPGLGKFTPIASSTTPHDAQGAVSLPDGKVLVIGKLGSAYLFDPTTGTFAEKGPPTKFSGACLAPLPDGRVLVAGGWEYKDSWGLAQFSVSQTSVQIYDPETGISLSTASMHQARKGCVAVTLRDGRVLVAGGDGGELDSAEIFQLG